MKYLMNFSYDGSLFNGYQKQKNGRTVQGTIEETLKKITSDNIKIHGSGRTDALVHANNQYAHFETDKLDELKIRKALNSLLPSDIYIKSIEKCAEDFHARFSVIKKEYIYLINDDVYNPTIRNYTLQLSNNLNIDKMIEGASFLIGEHDFTSFSKVDLEKETMIRTIYKIEIIRKDIICIKIIGNGFLRYMVRNLVGALIDVGLGKKEPQYIKELLEKKDRTKGSKTSPACGLYLNQVYY